MSTNKPMSNLNADQAIAVGRAMAVQAMPYFGRGILELVPRAAPGLGTMTLSRRGILSYDPAVLLTWTPEEAGAVILHEYMHRFLNHFERVDRLIKSGMLADADRARANEWCDMEINDDLMDAGLKLPCFTHPDGSVATPCLPSDKGFPPNRLMEEYAALDLKKNPDPPPSKGGGAGSGGCGSCCGNPSGDHEPDDDDVEGRDEVEEDLGRARDEDNIRNARGNVPVGLRRHVEETAKAPKVSWNQKLAAAARRAVAFRAGVGDYTNTRTSRRQGAMVGLPMEPRLPGMRAPVASVAVVADTSGSITEEQVRAILTETGAVMKNLAGDAITFIACDAEVQSHIRTRSLEGVKMAMKGGGGTDFRPAFKALEASKPRPDLAIFATDGYGDYPARPPRGMKVIWLNIGGQIGVDWGEVIDVD